MKPVSVIIPTFNERENIIPLIRKIYQVFSPLEIIVVDDNSPDRTADEAKKIQKEIPCAKVIINKKRLGLTASIQTGIDCAKGKYIAWMDADFSHPPQLLNEMYKRTGQADIITGSWFIKAHGEQRKEKLFVIMSIIINRLCRLFFGNQITAYTSGFTLVPKKILQENPLYGDYGESFIYYLVTNLRQGKIILEVPFTIISRKKGITKTSPDLFTFIKNSMKYLKMIVYLVFHEK